MAAMSAAQDKWYVPSEKHFRTEYQRNPENPRRQSWDDYWGWIQKFYGGINYVITSWEGWTSLGKRMVAKVEPDKRPHIQAMWNKLGIRISQEWAKDNSLRKIDSAILRKWASEDLQEAFDADRGDGKSIEACLKRINDLVTKRLEKR